MNEVVSESSNPMKYRAEIDGLRAFSVIAVVLFHFFPNSFENGFLGVDIFFVISGFLITKQLMRKRSQPLVSTLKTFYTRRIKRLLPAVFVFLALTTLLAALILVEPDFVSFKQSLIPSMSFWANIFFWLDGGYFGGNSKLKMLLHMWSLSVEEQFYLIYPLFLLITFILFRQRVLAGLGAVILMSLGSLALCVYLYSIGGSNPAFFSLPTRMWQFGAGAMVAFISLDQLRGSSLSFGREAASLLSLILFALAFADIFSQLYSTIIVTIAAAIFIAAISEKSIFARYGFALQPVRFLGKISYSVYLYHWPIAVAISYIFIKDIPIVISWIGVLVSIILGYLSYKFVETPWRFDRSIPQCLALFAGCAVLCLCIIFGRDALRTKVNPADKMASVVGTHFRCNVSSYKSYGASRACELGSAAKVDIALLGNSHAQMYAPLVRDVASSKERAVLLIPLNACVPTPQINLNAACAKKAKRNLETLKVDRSINHVVISTTWLPKRFSYTTDDYQPTMRSFARALVEIVNDIEKTGKKVILLGPIQTPGIDLASELSRKIKFGHMSMEEVVKVMQHPKAEYLDSFAKSDEFLRSALEDKFIEPSLDLCDEQFCYFGRNNESYFADSNHIGEERLDVLYKLRIALEKQF